MSGLPNETVEQVVSQDTEQITALQAQISSLQSQLAAAQASLAQAQAALAVAQAQIVADAQTIATLQAQVTALQAQVAALQAQLAAYTLYETYFAGAVTLVGGGIYVPPAYDNPVINVSNSIIPPRITKQVTIVGGGYP
jgi:chromosome segregation ATPase